MTLNESWVEIEGFPDYLVSNTGFVYSVRSKKYLTPGCSGGYLSVSLGKGNQKLVHRLVVENFIGVIPDGYEVNHIDGDKTNNTVSNLEITTPSENVMHSFRSGLRKNVSFFPKKVRIKETDEVFESISSVARYLNVSPQAIHQALKKNYTVSGYKIESV